MYDLIGDIHGHCATLIKLLTKLGYREMDGSWQHADRKIIFVGDYIDRGPQIRETLQLVKSMTDAGHAIALMGNHEYNAVGYATADGRGDYLRRHNATHNKQHGATLQQFAPYPGEWEQYLQWFKTLPLYLDLGQLRAVHACWDEAHISWLKEKNYTTLTDALLDKAHQRSTREHAVIEEILKGKELNIPEEYVWYDKDGHARTANRIKWWVQNGEATYGDFLFSCPPEMAQQKIPQDLSVNIYPATAPPVFIGHYWLDEPEPMLQSSNVVCLDYSVAKDGYLVAYRWNGEQQADAGNFVMQLS
ncbi:MAG: phosphoesterase [Chitinophagaceae bacterium]|nr:MAG: phosphoesterase [Chitinophagaceae bacterium]